MTRRTSSTGAARTRVRDHRREYQRRKERGLARGLSLSEARGHRPKRGRARPAHLKRSLESALKDMKAGAFLKDAAKRNRIGERTLRRFLREQTKATFKKRRWIIKDRRPRRFPVYSEGQLKDPILRPREATKASAFMRGVDKFLKSGRLELLHDFQGRGVTNIKREFVPFETNPNALYQLDAAGELIFPEIYKIVS